MKIFLPQRLQLIGLLVGLLVGLLIGQWPAWGGTDANAEPARSGAARDWSQVQLAWRDDPRPPVDAPSGVEVPQPGRRVTRRAQRRAGSRRQMPLDGVPIDVASQQSQSSSSGQPPLPAPLANRSESKSITVETTLGSPFDKQAGPLADKPIRHRDQAYGTSGDNQQRFDIFLPAGCSGGRMPLVVWIHGDTWRQGSKSDCPLEWLISEGYAVASIGYRLSDTAVFPAQLDDCRAALKTITDSADVWGIDRARICVVGSAAGGHLASLVGFANPTRVSAVCAVAAPTHLPTLGAEHDRANSPASLLIGGPLLEFREAAQQASPLTHISADDPPCLLVHGDRDQTIPVDQSIRLDAALRAAGVESTLLVLAGAGHKPALDRSSLAGRALLLFLDTTLGPGIRGEETVHAAAPAE